ncbi:MAG: IS30 family transposase, partial [Mycobacterium sp.]
MSSRSGFRGSGVHLGVESAAAVREEFWKAVRSGLSPTAAATVAGVSGATGRKWAKAGGYQSNTKHRGTRYSQVKEAFWAALRSGMTPTQAAVATGVSENAARQWVAQAGYVPRTPIPAGYEPEAEATSRARAMTFIERCRLE